MDVHQKASLSKRYVELKGKVKNHLTLFEDFCRVKTRFHEGSPGKIVYGDVLSFINSNQGEWVEYQYLHKKFRIEVSYLSDYSAAILNTYEILPGTNDRSKRKYFLLDKLHIIVQFTGALITFNLEQFKQVVNQNQEIKSVPMNYINLNTLMEDYIDLVWKVTIEPAN